MNDEKMRALIARWEVSAKAKLEERDQLPRDCEGLRLLLLCEAGLLHNNAAELRALL